MGQISETYASPGLRLGLLLEDHPNAVVTHELVAGADLPDGHRVPAQFGGEGFFCVAKIDFGDGRPPIYGVKAAPANGNADQWTVLCTKTTGRALKRAGYPDDTIDLKALVAWRARNADIEAVTSGVQTQALTSGGPQRALGSGDPVSEAIDAAAAPRDRSASDDGDGSGDEVGVGPDDPRVDQAKVLIADLKGTDAKNFSGFLSTIGAPADPALMTSSEINQAIAWLDPDAGD